jgi:hypothetical protein
MTNQFAELHQQVVFGQANQKIIWQPRISCWYEDKKFADDPLPEPYQGMSVPEIHRALGVSARLYEFNHCFRRVEDPRVRFDHYWLNCTDEKVTIETPVGKQVMVLREVASTWLPFHVKWEVETEEELKVATWREEHCEWEWDQRQYETLMETVGDLGVPALYMPRMNVQSLYLEKMGTEKGIYAIHDWPDTVEAYFRALSGSHDRLIDQINASPIDLVNFGENIHAQTLPPKLFLKYHLPECQRRCEKLHEGEKFVYSHWDGDCAPLLPYARETGLDGIEAITPKPQGDVTLDEVKISLGDEMFLIDGIPAVFFDKTFSVETLKNCVDRLIDLFAPKLVLGISDELSSTGEIDRVLLVKDMVDQYNARIPAA